MILAAGAILASTATSNAQPAGERPVVLPRAMRASEALAHLGGNGPAAAAKAGASLAEWQRVAKDQTAWLDRNGQLFFVDPVADAPAAATAVAEPAPLPNSQTFLLNSKPGSSRVVYLDFDGQTVSGTAWNSTYGEPIVAPPYDTDGSPTTWSQTEHDTIQAVWQMVAEDFAPFDVNVTTQDPGYNAINRSSSTDTAFGTRVVVSPASVVGAQCGCGGVAYVGTYDSTGANHDYYQPAWVVNSSLKSIAEAASHEAGHNLGLSHDGTASAGYYTGHGSWAPIMGVGYSKSVVQWSKGEYSGANQTQDDFVIAGQNGLPLRTDDYGSIAAPTAAPGTALNVTGVIHQRTDADAFAFATGAGTVSFTATPAALGANLDIKLQLLDASGAVVASADPAVAQVSSNVASGLNASLTASVNAGTYRIVVDGVGFGDPLSTGYTDYGSVGAYSLSGSWTDSGTVNQAPTAAVTATPSSGTAPLAVTFNGGSSTDPDGSIVSYSWTFSNGGSATGVTTNRTYTTAGTYSATLTVADNSGATSSATATVTVTAQAVTIKVSSLAMTIAKSGSRRNARTVVTVTDQNGAPVNGVTVTGTYSGVVSGSVSGTTGTNGQVTLSSTKTTSASGTFTFTINSLVKTGTTYSAAGNLATTVSRSY